jgi:hypothetical protein
MTTTEGIRTPAATADAREVESYRGVRIGRALANGVVVDHHGVHVGRVTSDGDVVDHLGVRIGRVCS